MRGERDAARIAHEQRLADLFFETNDLGADRGLAEIQPATGAGETPHVGDGDERLKQRRVERILH